MFKGAKAVGEMSLPTVSSPSCLRVTPRPPSPGPSHQNRIKEKHFLVRPQCHPSNPQPGRGSPNLVPLAREPRKMLKSKLEVSWVVVNTLKEPRILILLVAPSNTVRTSIRDPSPNLRQSILTRQESNSNISSATKSKLDRTNSTAKIVTRSNSQRDVTRSSSFTRRDVNRDTKRDASPSTSRVTVRRVPSIRDSSPASKLRSASSETSVTPRRTGSRREESPASSLASRQRLGLRNASPNTSNVSLKTAANKRLGRSDSLKANKSNAASRSSSFNRSENKPAAAGRPGLATLPREAGQRSRSQPGGGDYVTVLEIGGSAEVGAARSKSASHRPGGLNRSVSRSNSIKKGESSGTVSVHIKHSQDVSNSHSTDSRPAPSRKQSIKIGRVETAPTVSTKTVNSMKRLENLQFPMILFVTHCRSSSLDESPYGELQGPHIGQTSQAQPARRESVTAVTATGPGKLTLHSQVLSTWSGATCTSILYCLVPAPLVRKLNHVTVFTSVPL